MAISPQAPALVRRVHQAILLSLVTLLCCGGPLGCDWLFGSDEDDRAHKTQAPDPADPTAPGDRTTGPRQPELLPPTSDVPSPPDTGPPPIPGDAPPPADQQQARFELGPPPSPTYRTAEPIAPESRALAALLRESTPTGGTPVAWSQCLARAAGAYASYHPHEPDIVPPRAFVEYALHWSGCPDSAAAVRLYYTTEHDTDGLADYVERILADADGEFTHVGIGRAPGGGTPYRWTWAVLMTRRHYDMDPLARSGPPGAKLPLRFQLAPRLSDPEVLVMPAGEPIVHVDLAEQPNGDWRAQVPLGDVPGEQWLEILATGELGPEVVALFPLYVGRPPPTAWTGLLPPDESWVRTASDAEHLMLRLVNRDRAEHGLAPLVWDDALATIARRHSADMRDQGYFGHVSPSGETLSDRFEALRYEARYSAENIARNPLVYDAQVGLMESLGHRANILSPRPTRIGIGVAVGEAANGERTFYLTQNFARPVMRPQASTLRAHMRHGIDQVRRQAGLDSLATSGKLDRIANEAARLAAESGFDGDRINQRISQSLTAEGIGYRRFRVQYQPVLELEDFDAPDASGESAVSRVGLGVADIAATGDSLAMLATLVLLIE